MDGKKVEDIALNENVFGIEVNEVAVHTALVNFQANFPIVVVLPLPATALIMIFVLPFTTSLKISF